MTSKKKAAPTKNKEQPITTQCFDLKESIKAQTNTLEIVNDLTQIKTPGRKIMKFITSSISMAMFMAKDYDLKVHELTEEEFQAISI